MRTLADCERLLVAAPDSAEAAYCFAKVGLGSNQGREAAERLERAIRLRSAAPWGHLYLGKLRLADPVVAERHFAQAAEEAQRLELWKCELEARANRSDVLRAMGRREEERRQIQRIGELVRLGRASLDPRHLVTAWLAEASYLTASGGDLDRALFLLDRVRKAVFPEGNPDHQTRVLYELSLAHYAAGHLELARKDAVALADLAREYGYLHWEAQGLYAELRAFREEMVDAPTPGCREQAIALARRTLEVAVRAGQDEVEGLTRAILAQIGDAKEAPEQLGMALAQAERAKSESARSFVLSVEARLLAERDPRRAEEAMASAIATAERSGNPRDLVYALRERMRLSWTGGPSPAARQEAFTDLAAIERLREGQTGKRAQPGLFSVFSSHYYLIAGKFLQSYLNHGESADLDAAFRVAELLRSRTLIDVLMGPRAQPTRFATLAEVRQALEPKEALLSFQIAPWTDMRGDFAGGSWLLVITRAGERLYPLRHPLVARAALRRAAQLFKSSGERRDDSERLVASELYQALLAEALRDLDPAVSRLVVIPDDALHLVPFAGLRPSLKAEPLTVRYQVESTPSATLFLGWRRAQVEPAATPLLVFANPSLPRKRLAGEEREADARYSAYGYGSLPHAQREGREAVRRLGGGSQLRVGADASEAQLKDLNLRPFEILHFAAHAILDEVDPERSAILLSPGDGEQDGLLLPPEIARLDLRGKVVVLAACRSAGGQVLRGEGVESLARAFFAAGSHTIVASLWPLSDRAGEAFFGSFYDHLGHGESVATAVRSAQGDRLRANAPAFDWAGLVVLGDGGTVPFPQGRPVPPLPSQWPWIAGLAALFAVAGAGYLWLRRAARMGRPGASGKAAGLPRPS